MAEPTSNGLEGVVVAETRLSDVDGENGRLILRGKTVEELASSATFEDACALFLDVDANTARTKLAAARVKASAWLRDGRSTLALVPSMRAQGADVMEALRVALAAPGSEDVWESIGLAAVALAAFARGRVVEADGARSHAEDLLRMLGVDASPASVRGLDTYLVTVLDHGMNASTFAARVVASTGSDLRSCLVAGVGALKGPLHGGAPGPVLDMLDAIAGAGGPDHAGAGTADSVPGAHEKRARVPGPAMHAKTRGDAHTVGDDELERRARAWIERELDAGRRIMGMGHRIYRVRDPRAFVLERAVEALPLTPRLALARTVERAAEHALARRHPERPLKANVEFFTAVLLDAIGIERALFSGLFACSRIVGWCAHVGEQRRGGRLIRPSSRFVG